MTREKAIKIIETGKKFAYDEKYNEAFDMAIKALEQEPTTKNDLAVDCVPRDVVRRIIKSPRSKEQMLSVLESVKAVQPRKGHWIHRWDKVLLCEDKNCSICGYLAQTTYNFCPYCGAKMDESEEV